MKSIPLLFIIIIIVFSSLLMSCNNNLAEKGNSTLDNKTDKTDVNDKTAISSQSTLCTPRWRCISSDTKAYQNESCGWSEKTKCKLGCNNGTCLAPPKCTVGMKCKSTHTKGYQIENCEWMGEEECNYGCKEGKCNPAPVTSNHSVGNNTTELKPVPIETVPEVPRYSLSVGEKNVIESNGQQHNLSIYLIESGRVRLLLDSQKTDWIEEGANYTFYNGIRIVVSEVLFQSYLGGLKEIVYKIE